MRRCLIVSAFFPPIGGVGVQRVVKFVKYLPQFGWQPVVVTLPKNSTRMKKDPSLLQQIPDSVGVHRPFFYDYRKIIPGDLAKLLRPLLHRVNRPDRYALWNTFAFKRIEEIAGQQQIDCVLCNVSPFSSLVLAARVRRELHLPVVVTLRDAFSFNNYYLMRGESHTMREAEEFEQAVFAEVDAILCVTPFLLQKYQALYPRWRSKFHLLTNGYDEEDFSFLHERSDERQDCFTIGYNGSISRLAPLEPLLMALSTIRRQHGVTIKLNIATGNSPQEIFAHCPQCRQDDLVEFKGFLPHRDSLSNLRSSHLLAITFANIPAAEGAYSGKIFEYLRLDKPILLLHKADSDLARLIQATHSGMTVDIDNQPEIIALLLSLEEQWRRGALHHQSDREAIRQFEYQNLTKELATFMAAVADAHGEKRGIESA